jgi:TRAP-type C4-dicarboxylate transport system substrate-binding protein
MALYAVPWPPQGIYSQEAAERGRRPEGREVARLQPATARIAELVGAQPVTVQAAELSQALATGVVEPTCRGSTGWDSKTYEHLKYWYDTQAWLPKNVVLVNKAAFTRWTRPRRTPC